MIKKWWKSYLEKENTWGHISNALFVLFIILMLIPATRSVVHQQIIKLTLFDWGSPQKEDGPFLSDDDKSIPLVGMDGVTYLADMEGEVILVNYWATWCPPCIAEMPNLQNLYNEYQGKMNFLFLTNDRSDAIISFLEKGSYDLPVYSYSRILPAMEHSSIPTTYIIDKKGQIIFSHSGAYKWDSNSVKGLLDELILE